MGLQNNPTRHGKSLNMIFEKFFKIFFAVSRLPAKKPFYTLSRKALCFYFARQSSLLFLCSAKFFAQQSSQFLVFKKLLQIFPRISKNYTKVSFIFRYGNLAKVPQILAVQTFQKNPTISYRNSARFSKRIPESSRDTFFIFRTLHFYTFSNVQKQLLYNL